ncbi:LruC domain-containing protein [Flammeovirga sp. EKP202]|uniref:LruC domain-containing protein n=1 Tax=Flammeovirga sp. EKP202 TaxID=2770592 RepID=UPI00165F67E3|nr:LruC domain-containing protein [Flammeovirga sp. EKP202]MBD0401421.1 LruC domain-containing protein [Flammeovirga sp. EKP202]
MKVHYLLQIAILSLLWSCATTITDDTTSITDNTPQTTTSTFADVTVPEGFNYSTSKELHIKVISPNYPRQSMLQLYYIDNHDEKVEIQNAVSTEAGAFETIITVPSYVEKLYMTKNAVGLIWEEEVNIVSNFLTFSFDENSNVIDSFAYDQFSSNKRTRSSCEDYLVAINGKGKAFTIHQENDYTITEYPDIYEKSYAMAYDQENDVMYYDVKGNLYSHTLSTGVSVLIDTMRTTDDNLNNGYPRMTMKDGKLFIGTKGAYAILDPSTGAVLKNISVQNLPDNKNAGGDLVFDSKGDLYQACSGGLYRLEMNADTTVYTATRISADNFPYYLTGVAIDRFDNIYVSTNGKNSKIIRMDKNDGSYAIVQRYNRNINDLAAFICSENDFVNDDADGDGISDGFDEYPNDPTMAFNNYYPGRNGFGTFAFEDLYPNEGDYDFNDVIVHYRHNYITNANNEVVKIKSKYVAKSVKATFNSGFGFALPFHIDSIASVTGSILNTNLVTLNAKGTETGVSDENPVVIVFDNQNSIVTNNGNIKYSDVIDMEMIFTSPISVQTLAFEEFNPFIFANEREREIHLPGFEPTIKFNTAYRTAGEDTGDYRTTTGHPWGLSIIHKFHPPKENIDITTAYNNFGRFVTSNGLSFRNWYTDDEGNRNTDKMYLDLEAAED